MSARARSRSGVLAVAAASVGLTLGTVRWADVRAERALALREATTTAAYLALVAPPARGGGDYDLPRLLIHARALDALPGFTAQVEVYHGTAPLVRATRPSLAAAQFEHLQRDPVARSAGAAMLAPLFDRDRWEVVGAVRAEPMGRRAVPWGSVLAALVALVTAALAAAGLGGAGKRSRRGLVWYAATAVLLGGAAATDIRSGAGDATDRWLGDARLLIQEAVRRVPELRFSLAALAPLARGAELVPGDSAGAEAWRGTVAGVARAVVAVRLAPGRWAELRTAPAEAGTAGWVALVVGLALLGPLIMTLAAWAEREAAHPQRRREAAAAWGFLAPSALHLVVFSFAPLVVAGYASLHRPGLAPGAAPFVGLGNFVHLARDPLVWSALGHTLVYVLYVPVSMILALAAALVLQRQGWGVSAIRTLFFLPYIASLVAVALVWQWMLADFGLVNALLSAAHLGRVDWLGNPRTALLAVMVVSIWVQLGYQMTVFLAGLQAVPQVYLDAARVEGASAWQRFRRITFPLLKPVTLFVLVTGVIGAFQVFTYVYVLTDAGPLHATDVMAYRIYQTGWELLQFGYASALSVLLFVVLFPFTRAQFRLLGRGVEYA